MMCGRVVFCLAVCSVFPAEARSLGRISPALDPKSSQKFNKDYPADKRPGVDVLHFNHPYPVVQDSGDFDKDYVKDENTDNGHWQAQQEYDRLRHKLKQEKKEAAKALDKKQEEEHDFKRALEKYQKELKDNADAAPQDEKEDHDHKDKVPLKKESKQDSSKGWSWSWDWWPFSWPTWGESESQAAPAPEPVEKGTGVSSAAKDTKDAMAKLGDCQKELEKARDDLKKLMDELDKAKGKQSTANAAAADATTRHLEAKTLAEGLHGKTSEEKAQHDAAEAAYLKQKANVDKLKAQLNAAAAKVKAQRDAADSDGGVYNTPEAKSSTVLVSSPRVLALLFAALAAVTCS